MDYKQKLFAEMDDKIRQINDIAGDLQRIADETEEFIGRYTERRSDPNRPNRCPSYSERKQRGNEMTTEDQDTIVDFGFGEVTVDMHESRKTVCPGTEVARGRYEGRLLQTLEGLRETLRYYNERRTFGNPAVREESYRKLRKTLDLTRKVQTLLNRTGCWSFLLADPS